MQTASALAGVLAPIQAAIDHDDLAQAARLARTAVDRGLADPLLFNLTAWAAEEAGDLEAAERDLVRGVALAPRDETLLAALASLLRKRLRPQEALVLLDRALAVAPGMAMAWQEKGLVLEMLGDRLGARAAHEQATRADPTDPEPPAALAALASLDGEWPAARTLAERAAGLSPGHPLAESVLARVEIAEGQPAAAQARMDSLLARRDCPADVRATALGLRGDALDRLGESVAAFADFAEAKRIARLLHAPTFGPGGPVEDHAAMVRRIHAAFLAQPSAVWETADAVAPGPASQHLFVLGYPRSGTTLVENILTASGGTSLEERPTLLDAERAFLADDAGMARLATATSGEIERYRMSYWSRVAADGVHPARGPFVDMAPLNGAKLPLIHRLFPEARVIVVRRDPRDVVLSCLRQPFRINAATYVFTDLTATADHYAATMSATDDYLARLPLAAHVLRYDDLVADFGTATRALFAFAGLAWTDAVRDFHLAARARPVRTASATQVRQPLYDGGGQWRRYADALAPVMPVLAPWIERYGFASA